MEIRKLNRIVQVLEEIAADFPDFCCDDENFCMTFKNEQVRRCLTKAGTILELITYLAAQKVTGKEGAPYYTDAMTGVFIDWDGVVHDDDQNDEEDIENGKANAIFFNVRRI